MNDDQKEYFGIYADSLEETLKEISDELEKILDSLADDPEHSPYEHISSRIKDVKSVKDKLLRKGYETDALTGIRELSDVLGIRIVTHFVGDIYMILESIRKHENWEILREKDYIAKPKENGYRSYHVIIRVPFHASELNTIKVELQLRTIAMDCWAALEHQMRYKKDVKNSALIAGELKRCSDEMASTDLTMQTIRDVLMD